MDNSSLDILGHEAEQCNSTELNDFFSIFPHCVYLFLYKERREEGTEIEREGGERQIQCAGSFPSAWASPEHSAEHW